MDYTLINIIVLIVILTICYLIHSVILEKVVNHYDNEINEIEKLHMESKDFSNNIIENLTHDMLLRQEHIIKYQRIIDGYKKVITNYEKILKGEK